MIHVGDNSWNLRVMITDLQVEKSLRVKGDLHIGGVMLKLSKTEGEFLSLHWNSPHASHADFVTASSFRDKREKKFFHEPNIFEEKSRREPKETLKFIIFLLKITLKVTCVLVAVLSTPPTILWVFHHREKEKKKKHYGKKDRGRCWAIASRPRAKAIVNTIRDEGEYTEKNVC